MEGNLRSHAQEIQGRSPPAEVARRRKRELYGRLEQEERVAGGSWKGGFEAGENRRRLWEGRRDLGEEFQVGRRLSQEVTSGTRGRRRTL